MVNILLGVTRDSVMRLDAETKEVLKVWPLTTLRRWAASPKSFTLDFGDYSDNYYSVETLEGDAISQLIAGYIDIIVKKKKDADRLMAEEDQEMSIVEDVVEGYNATSISMIPGRAGQLNMVDVAQAGVAYVRFFSNKKRKGRGRVKKTVFPHLRVPTDSPLALCSRASRACSMSTCRALWAYVFFLPSY